MRSRDGLVSHVLLSILILLVAGAIILSLETAPPVAQTQLQTAAKNTKGASGFLVTFVEVVTAPSLGKSASQSRVLRVAYQSPDRVAEHELESGQKVTVLVIGDNEYEKTGSGPWRFASVPSSGGASAGTTIAAQVLLPLQSAAGATSVTKSGNAYYYLPANAESLLESIFSTQASSLSGIRFRATIVGEFIRSQLISAQSPPYRVTFGTGFTSVDKVPPITEPKV